MRIAIASDSYKGSLSSVQVAQHIERGIRRVFADAQVMVIPIADGGEGTVDAMVHSAGGEAAYADVKGPDDSAVRARYALLPDGSAVLEMAAASGLTLVPAERRDILTATTYGTGQLIRAALDRGCRRIVIGIGGSATNDGGVGMAQALGFRFFDPIGNEIGVGGGALGNLARIDGEQADPRLREAQIIAICDVNNPLCGPQGASAVYGPQKGATPGQVRLLDQNLSHLAEVIRKDCGGDYAQVPGAGAAGGLGFGLLAFVGATLRRGIEVMLDAAGFDVIASQADLVITGEGRLDGQSARGKVPAGVAARAKKHGVPVIAIVGSIGEDASAVFDCGIGAVESAVCAPMDVETAMANAADLVADAAERAMRAIYVGMLLR